MLIQLQEETNVTPISEVFFTSRRDVIFSRSPSQEWRIGRRAMEHIDPSICDVELRLLCLASLISLTISGTVIFLLI
jgi:hypothetical protein